MDASSGDVQWRAARPVNRRRPAWSAPTLVVHDGVLLCGDRAVEAPLPDTPDTGKTPQWVVNSNGGHAPKGQITAFSAATGKKLWESECRESYNSPPDVLVADGLVWSGNLVSAREPGITTGRDLHTGEVVRTRPADQNFFRIIMGHHRCYRNKATEKYLVLGRDGVEMIDLATGKGFGAAWTRGACQYGVMPCNGLIYVPPHSCACHVESLINGFNALAPAGRPIRPVDDEKRLQRGPAYADIGDLKENDPAPPIHAQWPTYRHDAARSGRSSTVVAAAVRQAWATQIPARAISSPVIAQGKVFVAAVDTHTIHAVDANDGKPIWRFTAGGRIDSPPTFHRGTVIFGCADGRIYCLRASDGVLAWRFLAAPEDRRIVAHGQIESTWPVHGSVLVERGVIHAVAGRSAAIDGGMTLYRLDATSGKKLSETPITNAAMPDVLSCDGESVFLRHRRFDLQGVAQQTAVPHLYSGAGFLEDSWWHRTFWQVGTTMRSGWGAWPNTANQVPAGRILVRDGSTVYGFGRFNQMHRHGSHVGLANMQYLLYASNDLPGKTAQTPRRTAAPVGKVASLWEKPIPLLARGMVLSGSTLFIAGPPDVFPDPTEEDLHPYHVVSAEAIRRQEAALTGEEGGILMAVSTKDGSELAQIKLDAPPRWDGMAAAAGRLYIATTDGKLVCLGPEEE